MDRWCFHLYCSARWTICGASFGGGEIETTRGLPAVAVVFMCQQGTYPLRLFEIFGMIFDTEGVVGENDDFVPPKC